MSETPFIDPDTAVDALNPASSRGTSRPMQLTFRLENDDLSRFARLATGRGGARSAGFSSWPVLLAASFVAGLVVLGLLYFLQSPVLQNPWFYVALLLGVTLSIFLLQGMASEKAVTPLVDGPTLGRRVYELEDEGLIITQDGIQQAWMWQSIREVVENDDAIYMFVDANAAHIFPKNVFASPIHAREFAAYVREKVALAKQG